MDYTIATNKELMTIIDDDKNCPTHLLSGVIIESISRRLLDGIIMYAAKIVYRNVNFVLNHRLFISHEELIHIGHIEIMRVLDKHRKGARTFKSYIIMCLRTKFMKMRRDADAEKRRANIGTKRIDQLDEDIQTSIFTSNMNVERQVINKITIENIMPVLNENEREAIYLEQSGYSQYEIAEMLGYKSKTHGNTLLRRAYAKLRKQLGA